MKTTTLWAATAALLQRNGATVIGVDRNVPAEFTGTFIQGVIYWISDSNTITGVSSKLEGRLGPDSHRVHRDGRGSIRRRSLSPDPRIGMIGAEAPWVRSVRTSHLWW